VIRPAGATNELRVVVLAPTGKDAALTQSVFERAGIDSIRCDSMQGACDAIDDGAAALLVAEEAVGSASIDILTAWLERQPPWSDMPILVLARPGADSSAVGSAMDLLGNVTVLERPMRVASLVSAVRSARRARLRQYQIREHLAEREQASKALRDADQRKNEFLAVLAHELRNPLSPIRNSLHILRLAEGDRSIIVQVAAMLERQVNHLVRLVDDLLEISRITRGKVELRREHVDLATVLRAAIEASRPQIDAARHVLKVSIPPEPLVIDADPVRMAQVFTNLLNNAAKYTEPGGDISITVEAEEHEMAIKVRDSGTGIPEEMISLVFDLFVQVDQPADRVQGGLGIGLTLVKRLVEMHGGRVQASSDGEGKGSEFLVCLPRVTSAVNGSAEPGRATSKPRRVRRRVLVVDDNRDAADSLAVLLRMLGADVRVEYSGADALSALPEYKPGVALLDIGMPGMDGFEVARRIRQQADYRHVTLIALTGWGQKEDIRRTREAGFEHHLIKPADVSTLQELLLALEDTPQAYVVGTA
jgi:signal transduction histidine kinase/ActR/RegA family two-component response regulator